MRYPFCPLEEKVAAMIKRIERPGNADAALLEHARTCSRCREVLFALEMLHSGRASAMMSAPAASPGYLWWRAQLRRKSGSVEQMARPVLWAERLALAIMLCAVAGVAFWQKAQFASLFTSYLGWSILAGLTAILCVGGLTLFLSYRRL